MRTSARPCRHVSLSPKLWRSWNLTRMSILHKMQRLYYSFIGSDQHQGPMNGSGSPEVHCTSGRYMVHVSQLWKSVNSILRLHHLQNFGPRHSLPTFESQPLRYDMAFLCCETVYKPKDPRSSLHHQIFELVGIIALQRHREYVRSKCE
jgi:hypothetical protein